MRERIRNHVLGLFSPPVLLVTEGIQESPGTGRVQVPENGNNCTSKGFDRYSSAVRQCTSGITGPDQGGSRERSDHPREREVPIRKKRCLPEGTNRGVAPGGAQKTSDCLVTYDRQVRWALRDEWLLQSQRKQQYRVVAIDQCRRYDKSFVFPKNTQTQSSHSVTRCGTIYQQCRRSGESLHRYKR